MTIILKKVIEVRITTEDNSPEQVNSEVEGLVNQNIPVKLQQEAHRYILELIQMYPWIMESSVKIQSVLKSKVCQGAPY